MASPPMSALPSLVDEMLPVYDVSDTVATVVAADLDTTWQALLEVDLLEVGRRRPLVGLLGALRSLPAIAGHVLHGEAPPTAPSRMRLRDTTLSPASEGGWILLGERPGDELALGLVGKFWRPIIEFAAVPAEDFRDFATAGFAKTVYALAVRRLDARRTLLSGTMRTATTDDRARTWFRRYWTLGVGSGAHVLVQGVLDVARERAEEKAGRGAAAAADRPAS
jgi:hypothetical protein